MTMLLATGLLVGQIFAATTSIEIKLKHNSAAETQTRQQLEMLLQKYPLTPWYFTSTKPARFVNRVHLAPPLLSLAAQCRNASFGKRCGGLGLLAPSCITTT